MSSAIKQMTSGIYRTIRNGFVVILSYHAMSLWVFVVCSYWWWFFICISIYNLLHAYCVHYKENRPKQHLITCYEKSSELTNTKRCSPSGVFAR